MNVTSRVVNSAIFSASAKLISKFLGVISTMALARILAPQDFGYIAIVSIALYFFDILSHAASEQYIIQKTTVSRRELHTAWTANLILKLAISIIVVVLAPWIAIFFERPELTNAFRLSALILPIQALKSPIYILLKRQLKFAPLFWSSLAERLFAVPLVITLAFILESFWAFIVTDIAANVFAVLISYIIAKKLPKFTLLGVATQWTFSKWMMAKSVVGYMRSQVDTIFVSKVFSAEVLGNYHMARDVAMMPAHFLLGPAVEPLLSAFKNDKHDKQALLNNVAFSLIIIFTVGVPVCAVIWTHSPEIISLLLGADWQIASTLLPILSLLFLYWSLMQVVETALVAQGKVRLVFVLDTLSLITITSGLLIGILSELSVTDIAWIRVILGIISCLIATLVVFASNFKYLVPVFWIAAYWVLLSVIWHLIVVRFVIHSPSQADITLASFTNFFVSIVTLILVVTVGVVAIGRLSQHYQILRFSDLLSEMVSKVRANLY